MEIKLSVILPSYNVADYIEQCVESVINQTLKEIEILCIDAGSDDGTYAKLEHFAAIDPRVKLIKSERKSYGFQMNKGLRAATGEYIGIVETDDYIDCDMYEMLYRKAKESNAQVSKALLYETYTCDNGKEKNIIWNYIPDWYDSEEAMSTDEFPSVHEWDGGIWSGIYRRTFLLDNNIYFQETPGASFQDIAFQQTVLNLCQSIVYTRWHFYHYRRVRVGASTWNPKCVSYIAYAYKTFFENSKLNKTHKKYIYKRFAPAFLNELKKSLCMSEYDISKMEGSEYIEWYEKEIRGAIKSGELKLTDIEGWKKEEVLLFLADREAYIAKVKSETEAMYNWLYELKCQLGNRKLVVFGVGQYGMLITHFLYRNGVWVDGIADNQPWIVNNSIYDMRIMNADDAVRYYPESLFLIANKKNSKEICEQLRRKGVKDDQLFVYDGSDKTLHDGIKTIPILSRRHT